MFPTEWTTWLVSQMNCVPVSVEIIVAFEFLATFRTGKVLNTSMDRVHVHCKSSITGTTQRTQPFDFQVHCIYMLLQGLGVMISF